MKKKKKNPERLFDTLLLPKGGLAPVKAGTAKEWHELCGWYYKQYASLALGALRQGFESQKIKRAVDTAIAMGGGEEATA